MENTIDKKKEFLDQWEESIKLTHQWFNFNVSKRVARLQSLFKQIEKDNVNEEVFAEIERIQKELNDFQQKANFERKEIDKFEKYAEDLEKNSQLDFKKQLKTKLSKNFLKT